MKTTVRIVTLSLALGLAGAMTAAWGAQSVVELISSGESAIGATKTAKAALDAAVQKNAALSAQGNAIRAEEQKLQADIAALKQAADDYNQKATDYKTQCAKPKTDDQFNACKAENAQLKATADQLRTQPAALNKRQNTFISEATAYNQQVKDAPNMVKDADTKYRNAISMQYVWLDKARDMVASPSFQPYAKKAGCPNVAKPAKSQEAATIMSDEVLSCLRKVAGTN